MYRTAVDFLQIALNLDLALGGSAWLFEHVAARHFVETGGWPAVAEAYRHATREFAVADSFESVLAAFATHSGSNGSGAPLNGDGAELRLSVEQLQRYLEPQPDLENYVQLVRVAVTADQEDRRV